MKKLFTKIGQRVRNKSKQILAMLLCVTMLTPMAARAIITDGIYQAPEVARTWDENQYKGANANNYEPTGLAVNYVPYPMYVNNRGGASYPLGAAMSFKQRPGYENEKYKNFANRYAYCVADHVQNYLVTDGMQAFFMGAYNTEVTPDFVKGSDASGRKMEP